VLSLVTGLSCHHRLRFLTRKLDASVGASGPHAFAVRNIAARPRAQGARDIVASTAACHNVSDVANAPLAGQDAHQMPVICLERKVKLLATSAWTSSANHRRNQNFSLRSQILN